MSITIQYESHMSTIPIQTYIMIWRAFFTFSSSPHHVIIWNPAKSTYIIPTIDTKLRKYFTTSVINTDKGLLLKSPFVAVDTAVSP